MNVYVATLGVWGIVWLKPQATVSNQHKIKESAAQEQRMCSYFPLITMRLTEIKGPPRFFLARMRTVGCGLVYITSGKIIPLK